MSASKTFHCIVDDTALITNISEIETWVLRGAIALVVPLHTLERLHLLKKDTSQIGQNARKAVKFLDDATSNPDVKVFIQEPDDQYPSWAQVEAHYNEAGATRPAQQETAKKNELDVENSTGCPTDSHFDSRDAVSPATMSEEVAHLSLDKLAMGKGVSTSPLSTPPLSSSSSAPQSTKTSPEVTVATIITDDLSPVPPTLKTLINPVVWYTHEKGSDLKNIVFLTNSSDTAYLTRDFGVVSKNIHQLRAAIGTEEQEAKNHDKYKKKHAPLSASKSSPEPKTLFRYEDGESEEEEVVFKPRGRGSSKGGSGGRGGSTAPVRGKGHAHSPANSMSGSAAPVTPAKPQIPTEEIDPDSFDRGGFARGSTPLVSVGNLSGNSFNGSTRSPTHRGNNATGGTARGAHHRGSVRGFDRGSGRGRGRLFVP